MAAERLIVTLKNELSQLEYQAADGSRLIHISSLRQQNEDLKKEVEKWKANLVEAETRCGITQVAKPTAVSSSQTTKVNAVQHSDPNVSVDSNPKVTEEAKKPQAATKEKKEAKKTKPAEGAPKKPASTGAEQETNADVDIGLIDLRVGRIVDVSKHPDADSLYVEQVDLGEARPRTIVSGLVKHVPLEEMQNRVAIFMCNLKPAKMRGVLSEGMLMCASSPDKVEILLAPEGSAPGDLVHVDGYTRRPEPVLNPKKKIWESVAPDLRTDAGRTATYKGAVLTVLGKGPIVAPSLSNVQIK